MPITKLDDMTHQTSRRALLFSGAALLAAPAAFAQARRPAAAPSLSAADQALVDRAVAYLQGMAGARGRFTQTDPRGRTATGDFYLQRPGKMRFAYDPPNKLLLVSNGNQVAVADARLGTYDLYALNMTPLSLFLAKEIRLDRGVAVSNVTRTANGFSLTASDRNRETPGSITLIFADNPMRLSEWTMIDAQRGRTRVVLNSLTPASGLDRALFVLPRDPRPRAPARGR